MMITLPGRAVGPVERRALCNRTGNKQRATMRVKPTTIIFDLDDTLAPDHTAVDAAFLAACGRARGRVDPATLAASVHEQAREHWSAGPLSDYRDALGPASWEGLLGTFEGGDARLAAVREWVPHYRRAVWTSALAAHGISDQALAGELAEAFQEERWALCRPYPDVLPALQDLGRDYALAMLTNGIPDIQRTKLSVAGLAGHFRATVISGEVGIGKPDPRMFRAVLKEIGAPAAEAVMVGNSPKRDIAGAQAAGILAVQIARYAPERADGIVPHALIRNLGELRSIIEQGAG